MIINDELFELEDQCDKLIAAILTSQSFLEYQEAKQNMAASETATLRKIEFQQQKERFDKIAAYGTYAPGYREEKRALWQKKRKLDMDEAVASFRVKETNVQTILDTLVQVLATTISTEIKVDAGNPFFTTKHSGCGGHCHASK